MLDQPSLEVLVEGRVHFFGQDRLYAMGPESDRSTVLRDRDLERHQGARPKVRLRGRKHIEKFAEHITQLLDGRGGPSRVMYAKRNLPQVWRQSGPDAQERRTLAWVQSFQQQSSC